MGAPRGRGTSAWPSQPQHLQQSRSVASYISYLPFLLLVEILEVMCDVHALLSIAAEAKVKQFAMGLPVIQNSRIAVMSPVSTPIYMANSMRSIVRPMLCQQPKGYQSERNRFKSNASLDIALEVAMHGRGRRSLRGPSCLSVPSCSRRGKATNGLSGRRDQKESMRIVMARDSKTRMDATFFSMDDEAPPLPFPIDPHSPASLSASAPSLFQRGGRASASSSISDDPNITAPSGAVPVRVRIHIMNIQVRFP